MNCANNPIMFIDPDGNTFDWSGVTKKEKQYIKAALHQYLGSKSYRNVMRVLRRSDFIYDMSNKTSNPTSFGEFTGGYDIQVEMESEIEGEPPEIYIFPMNSEKMGGQFL